MGHAWNSALPRQRQEACEQTAWIAERGHVSNVHASYIPFIERRRGGQWRNRRGRERGREKKAGRRGGVRGESTSES